MSLSTLGGHNVLLAIFLGTPMAEEVPDTAGAAVRNLLGTIGFITIMIGAEIMAERSGQRFYLGLGLVCSGMPIFFMGVFWKWLRKIIGSSISIKLEWFADDPRWWAFFLLIFLILIRAAATPIDWIWIGAALGGLAIFLFNWRNFKPPAPSADSSPQVTQSAASDGQATRDILLLLNFAVHQTTVEFLEELINAAPMEITEEPYIVDAERYEKAQKYVQYLRGQLDGTYRGMDFNSHLNQAEHEAERYIKTIPQEKLPPGIHTLDATRWVTANLQCYRAVKFLTEEKKEIKQKLSHQRSGLIERLNLRD